MGGALNTQTTSREDATLGSKYLYSGRLPNRYSNRKIQIGIIKRIKVPIEKIVNIIKMMNYS